MVLTLISKKMKNYIKYTIYILALFTLSCSKDFLDRTPGVALNEDAIFADPALAARFADDTYFYMINDYVRFNSYRGSVAQASDEAVSGNSENTVTTLNKGLYHEHALSAQLNDIGGVWVRSYQGIANSNKMLQKLAAVPVNEAVFPKRRVEGEMYFLRAFAYFELIKRFGGVPIVDRAYAVNEELNLPRNTYEQCVNFILSDIEKAIPLLGSDADYGASNYGRATKNSAKALKARVLLYAASPLNNPTSDASKWKLAAYAAQEIISGGEYALQATYNDILNVPSSSEYIMIKVRGVRPLAGGMLQDYAMSPGSGGAQGQMNPTQNHVDMYEMANGKAITDPTSGYNPQNPYANRDPRFYANIIYNDMPWQGRRIQMWANSLDYSGSSINYTATRYYCRKYWPENYRTVGGTTTLINYLFFRYAEILLNYAEARNEELSAPSADNNPLTIYAAVNSIRARAGMPNLPTGLNKDQMRVAIRHERAIELAFEDHRWYDIMRWKIGASTIGVPMYGMDVIRNTNGTFTYTPVVLGPTFQKVWVERQNLYPIPRAEVYKSKGVLVQNPGWE